MPRKSTFRTDFTPFVVAEQFQEKVFRGTSIKSMSNYAESDSSRNPFSTLSNKHKPLLVDSAMAGNFQIMPEDYRKTPPAYEFNQEAYPRHLPDRPRYNAPARKQSMERVEADQYGWGTQNQQFEQPYFRRQGTE
jgi:hypothetical protein